MLPKHLKSCKRTLSLLERCPTTRHLNQIHNHLTVTGSISDPYAAGKLVAAFSLSGDLRHARLLLLHLRPSTLTPFAWNSLFESHADAKQPLEALSLYKLMLAAGRRPDNFTFSFLLRSCSTNPPSDGQDLHSHILKLGWEPYDFVRNGLLSLYLACNRIDSASKLFDYSPNRDVVSWTAMVDGYSKAGLIADARELFDRMPERNAVSFSAMITSYSRIGMFNEALDLFHEMQKLGVRPNHAGVVGALSACGFLGALDQGKWIHAFVDRNGFEFDRVLGTALIDMYGKCGSVEAARQVFDAMPDRDVFAYTSMLSVLSNHGHGQSAVELFGAMREEGVSPNGVTFVCVITACGRMGLVEKGREIFESMGRVYGVEPGVEHYGCLVDLLGRAGLLEEARRVVTAMPMEPDSYVLGALLNACRASGDTNLGRETVESLADRGLDHSGVHVLMSNMYASACKWEDVVKARKGMEEKNVRKVPGCSMIVVDGVVCEFVAGDRSHEFLAEITLVLKGMYKQLKAVGFDFSV